DQHPRLVAVGRGNVDPQGRVDLGETLGEDGVDDDALDLDYLADILGGLSVFSHMTPGEGLSGARRTTAKSRRPSAASLPERFCAWLQLSPARSLCSSSASATRA